MPHRDAIPFGGTCATGVDSRLRDEVVRWFCEYVAREHPALGRTGAVCPFVEPAMRAGTLLLEVHRLGPHVTRNRLLALIRQLVSSFHGRQWPRTHRTLRALVALLPDLSVDGSLLLDQVQSELKPALAGRGLVLGRFHPHCDEPGVRNPAFAATWSPLPLVVLRGMVLNDIVFLNQERRCFLAYRERFGDRYACRGTLEPLLVELYQSAARRFLSHLR